MSDIQYKSTHSTVSVCDVAGHPNYSKLNWEQFNKGLTAYMRKRGLLDEAPFGGKVRGIAARAQRMRKNKEIEEGTQEEN